MNRRHLSIQNEKHFGIKPVGSTDDDLVFVYCQNARGVTAG